MFYGCDSNTGQACKNSSNVQEPLDFYIGELGYATTSGGSPCGEGAAFNTTAANEVAQRGNPVTTWGYWFTMGPKADPNYNGTSTEAYDWGHAQGTAAAKSWNANLYVFGYTVFADIETYVPSNCSAPASMGWLTGQTSTDYTLNQEVWKGFKSGLVETDSKLVAGIYSSPYLWTTLMDNISISGVPIWTSETSLTSNTCPTSMSEAGTFGGGTLHFWQFSITGGDYDVAETYPG
ncbi:MAG: hypothetical protein ACYCYO_16805 [Bacilli bacterium]